jgi:general secretion pathway protein G
MTVWFAALLALATAPSASPSLLAQTTPAASLQDSDAEALKLLPKDAEVIVRLESMDKLLALVNRFGAAGGAPSFNAEQLVEDLGLPVFFQQIETGRPVWFAFAASPKSPAGAFTYVLPTRDPQAFIAGLELEDEGLKALPAGGYVGLTNASEYSLATEPSQPAAKLRPGLLSAHANLATLIETYRQFIEMGLESWESAMDQMPASEGGPDMQPMFEAYTDLARDLIDSADGLDLALAENGPSLELAGSLSTLEGSPMAGWGAGTPVEIPPWPAQIDPNATLSMASAGDWALLMQRMKPLTEASVAMYPESMRGFMNECLASSQAIYSLMGPSFASFDLGEGGMRAGYVSVSEKPAELMHLVTSLMSKIPQGDESIGISCSAPAPVSIDKLQAQRFRVKIDAESLAKAWGDAQVVQPAVAELEESMARIWGKDGLDLTIATQPKSVAVALGGDEEFVRSVLVEHGPATVPPDLQRALAAVKGSNTAFIYRFDLGRLMQQMSELMPSEAAPFSLLSMGSLPMCTWGSIRGRVWSSGVSVDMESLLALVTAVADMEPGAAAPADDPELGQAVIQMQLSMVVGALELYGAENGHYPATLAELVEVDAAGQSFLHEMPIDPWNRPYVYEPPSSPDGNYRLLTYGADGVPGGEGLNADVDSESLRAR